MTPEMELACLRSQRIGMIAGHLSLQAEQLHSRLHDLSSRPTKEEALDIADDLKAIRALVLRLADGLVRKGGSHAHP